MATAIRAHSQTSVVNAPRRASRVRFRLSAMLWFYALAASAMATLSTIQEYAWATAALGVWLALIKLATRRPRSAFTPRDLLALVVVTTILAVVGYSALSRSHDSEQVDHCRNKMRRIAVALLDYRSQHGGLPPAQVKNREGSIQSWRALILPYLTVSKTPAVNGPEYCCPHDHFSSSQHSCSASYFAVTGAGTAWDALQSATSEIGDRPDQTILFLEELDRGFDWAKPRDLDFQEALDLLTQPVGARYVHLTSGKPGYFEKRNPTQGREGVNAAFADGSVRYLPLPLPEELATALLTARGGERISDAEMATLWRRELNHGKAFSFSALVLLGLLPGLRLIRFRTPRSERKGASPR